jgi:hypothetical protein
MRLLEQTLNFGFGIIGLFAIIVAEISLIAKFIILCVFIMVIMFIFSRAK